MKLKYYEATDSLYVDLSEKPSSNSREIAEGVVLDSDAAENLVGIDIDNASMKVALDKLVVSSMPGTIVTERRESGALEELHSI